MAIIIIIMVIMIIILCVKREDTDEETGGRRGKNSFNGLNSLYLLPSLPLSHTHTRFFHSFLRNRLCLSIRLASTAIGLTAPTTGIIDPRGVRRRRRGGESHARIESASRIIYLYIFLFLRPFKPGNRYARGSDRTASSRERR